MAVITTHLGNRVIKVELDHVVWFKAQDKFVAACMLNGAVHIMPKAWTIRFIGETYPDKFLRVSSSQAVAISRLAKYTPAKPPMNGGFVYLVRGGVVRVTERYVGHVRGFMLEHVPEPDEVSAERLQDHEWYPLGVKARQSGQDKSPPPGLSRCARSWWLAGWNDRDIEANLNRRKRPVY